MNALPVVPPVTQQIAIQALRMGLDAVGVDVPVSSRPPEEWPARFVVCARTGGSSPTMVEEEARLFVECFADTEVGAEQLAGQALAAFDWCSGRMIDRRALWWERIDGPTRFDPPDRPNTRFRFQFRGALRIALR